jgi:low temperature requirement protein LtrA
MRIAVSRAPSAEREVTPLELFFDLVYVFAIGQLSHHLLEHVDLRTGAETVIMALAVVYAWSTTAWGANWLEPNRLPVRLANASTSSTPRSRAGIWSSASGCSSTSRWVRPY